MVDRFLINLNRGEGQEEKLARWKRRKESLTIYTFFLIFLVLTLFNYNNYKALDNLIKAKDQKIRRINRELVELQKKGRNVSKADVLALARLEQQRFLWTKKFWALAEILPQGVAVTGMQFVNEAFIIKFIAKIKPEQKDFEKIAEIMGLLKNTENFYKDFMDIKFDKSHRIKVENQDILSFSVVCSLRKTIKAKSAEKTGLGRRM